MPADGVGLSRTPAGGGTGRGASLRGMRMREEGDSRVVDRECQKGGRQNEEGFFGQASVSGGQAILPSIKELLGNGK